MFFRDTLATWPSFTTDASWNPRGRCKKVKGHRRSRRDHGVTSRSCTHWTNRILWCPVWYQSHAKCQGNYYGNHFRIHFVEGIFLHRKLVYNVWGSYSDFDKLNTIHWNEILLTIWELYKSGNFRQNWPLRPTVWQFRETIFRQFWRNVEMVKDILADYRNGRRCTFLIFSTFVDRITSL